MSNGPSDMVDVALVLEGTYPFVSGGVSSWVHGLISGMPDLTFGLLFLGAKYEPRKLRFELPQNVRYLSEWAVYDALPCRFPTKSENSRERQAALDLVQQLCFDLQDGHMKSFDKVFDYMERRVLSPADVSFGPNAWKLLKAVYDARAPEISFLDFFWTWRFAYLPVLNAFFVDILPARVYHTICTGWAGVLAAIAQKKYKAPLLLTEHGIYLNERRIEISSSDWIYSEGDDDLTVRRELGYFKELWINLFQSTAQLCYDRCDAIYTLYGGNKEMQIGFGAREDLIQVIPNGVEIDKLTPSPEKEAAKKDPNRPLRVGFVGRVVPIKDVKTLIRACRKVVEVVKNVEILLMGPTDEDKAYFQECQDLVKLLELGDKLKFLGKVNVRDYFPTLDVQVLTSISEGQPLVILEGYCAGVPVVATNVGACKEMIEGLEPEDKELGTSGIITKIGNPEETAAAIIKILSDAGLRERMGVAARQRVRRFYDYRQMIARYRQIYETYRTGAYRSAGGNERQDV